MATTIEQLIREVNEATSRFVGVKGKAVYVGLPADRIHEPSGLPLSVVGAVHEFGLNNIPERSFLRGYMKTKKKEVVAKKRKVLKAISEGKIDAEAGLEQLALWAQGEVQEYISQGSQHFKPLSPATIARRKNKSQNPLNDTGALRQGIIGIVADAKDDNPR